MLLPLLAFVFGSILVGGAAFALMPNRAIAIDRRLEELTTGRVREDDENRPTFDRMLGFVKRVGEKAPRSAKELGSLRLRLVQAGYRRDEAMTVFFGIRIVFALALFALFATSLMMKPNITLALGGLAIGYLLPGMALARMAKRRAHRIRLALADALDLLVVSVEAGLGLDQALTRVGAELAFAYPGSLRRAAARQPRAARRQASARGAAQPRRPHRRRRPRLARDHAHPDRQVRHERGPGAARLLGDAADQAPPARRGSGREDGREDGVPARRSASSRRSGSSPSARRRSSSSRCFCRWWKAPSRQVRVRFSSWF